MFNNIKINALIFFFCITLQNLLAQKNEVGINFQKDTIVVGEQTKLELFVKTEKENNVVFHEYKDTLNKEIEVLGSYKANTKEEIDFKTVSKTYLLTSFDTGTIVVPPLTISIINGNDSIFVQSTERNFYVKAFVHIDTIPRDTCYSKYAGTIIRGHDAFKKEIAQQIPDSIRESISTDSLQVIENLLREQFANIFSSQITQTSGLYNETDINKIIYAPESALFIVNKGGILEEEAILGNLDSLYVEEFQQIDKNQILFTSFKIKDISENFVNVPFNFSEFLYYLKVILSYAWWILLIIIFILGIIYLIYYKRKHKIIKTPIFRKKIIPAHIIALKKLNEIRNEKLFANGQIKEYYVQISDTLREYLENRYGINITDMTTTQILTNINSLQLLDPNNCDRLKYILQISDLVKFAKYQPLQNDNDNCLNSSFDLVNSTKKEEKIEKEEQE